MSKTSLPSAVPGLPVYPLRVHRVQMGQFAICRMLSAKIHGVFIHFVGRGKTARGHYCKRAKCPPVLHKEETTWRGYVSADVWQPAEKLWLPVALELTEHAECEMRLTYARGQIWELSRLPEQKGRSSPLQAVLLEERSEALTPHELDLVPCLRNFYHQLEIDLTAQNPMPLKTMVRPSADNPPVVNGRAKPRDPEISAEEREEVKKKIREWNTRFKGTAQIPVNGSTNGKTA